MPTWCRTAASAVRTVRANFLHVIHRSERCLAGGAGCARCTSLVKPVHRCGLRCLSFLLGIRSHSSSVCYMQHRRCAHRGGDVLHRTGTQYRVERARTLPCDVFKLYVPAPHRRNCALALAAQPANSRSARHDDLTVNELQLHAGAVMCSRQGRCNEARGNLGHCARSQQVHKLSATTSNSPLTLLRCGHTQW